MDLSLLKKVDLNNPIVKSLLKKHLGDKVDIIIPLLSKFLQDGAKNKTQKKELDTLINGNSKFSNVETLLKGLADGIDMQDAKNLLNVAKGFFK